MSDKPSESRNSPRLQDVARRAGVSPASVSRVLNNIPPVSDRLRERVEHAVSELGYVPKNRIRSMVKRPLIVVFSSDLLNPYFNEVSAAVSESAAGGGATTLLVDLHRDGADFQAALDGVEEIHPVGYVILGPAVGVDDLLVIAERVRRPVVVVNQMVDHPAIRTVNIDYVSATRRATNHLIGLGHRRIAYLGASLGSLVNKAKLRGVDSALRKAGLAPAAHNLSAGVPTVDWGFTAAKRLFSEDPPNRPTGLVCECDLVALGVLHAARSYGLVVPRDLSVVGIDDIAMACHSNPPLTTISPPTREMGRVAVKLVLRGRNATPDISDYTMIESPLVVRESTGPYRESDER